MWQKWNFATIYPMVETTVENTVEMPTPAADAELQEMLEAGVHLGHVKSKNHPSMRSYIFGVRNTVSLIDLTKTKEKLAASLEFIRSVAARGGIILLAGTRPSARAAILKIAGDTKMPYFVERWIGGTLTNFKVMAKRVEYMTLLEKEQSSGGFEKYTKKERAKKGEELVKLRKFFDGLRTLVRLPDAVFVVDITHDITAVREARKTGIPLVALVDTNSNADLVDWPIPANDDAIPAVRYMVERIGHAIAEGEREAAEKAEKAKKAEEEKAE